VRRIRLDNYILKAFSAATLLALVMIILALGLIYLFNRGLPLPLSIVLILGAIAFVLSASFFERYEVGSIVWSLLVSIITTLALVLISGGIVYLFVVEMPGWEDLVSSLAVSMVVSMVLLNYLKRSLGQIEGY
jgi:branched-subunit amino acid ABC-type transport system permease component